MSDAQIPVPAGVGFFGPGRWIFIAVILIILLFFFAIIATPAAPVW